MGARTRRERRIFFTFGGDGGFGGAPRWGAGGARHLGGSFAPKSVDRLLVAAF